MIFFLVEDFSMKVFLEGVLPRLAFEKDKFEIKAHRGKEDLITNLKKIVPSLSKSAQQVIILIDQDRTDCKKLKNDIVEKMCNCACEYKIRIACYELETWFLGDMEAIAKCSPRFKPHFYQNKRKYCNAIDKIKKPSDIIKKIVPDWEKNYLSKPKFASEIAQCIALETKNRSHSFNVFLRTLKNIQITAGFSKSL